MQNWNWEMHFAFINSLILKMIEWKGIPGCWTLRRMNKLHTERINEISNDMATEAIHTRKNTNNCLFINLVIRNCSLCNEWLWHCRQSAKKRPYFCFVFTNDEWPHRKPPNAKEFCLKPFENKIHDNDGNTNARQKFYISCSMLRADMQTVYYNNPIS